MSNKEETPTVGEHLDLQTKYILKLILDIDKLSTLVKQYTTAYNRKVEECNELNSRLTDVNNKLEELQKINNTLDEKIIDLESKPLCSCGTDGCSDHYTDV
jgi:DNA repair exonuclease SbcCD ATPase subunit